MSTDQKFYLLISCIAFKYLTLISAQNTDTNTSVTLNIDLKYSKSLICYQCNSSSNDLIHSCQKGYFKANNPAEMLGFYFQCPPHVADYCFTFEENLNGFQKTLRGCYGDVDKNGRKIKSGCMIEEYSVLCFCNQILCNTSQTQHHMLIYLLMVFWFTLNYLS